MRSMYIYSSLIAAKYDFLAVICNSVGYRHTNRFEDRCVLLPPIVSSQRTHLASLNRLKVRLKIIDLSSDVLLVSLQTLNAIISNPYTIPLPAIN